MISFLKHAIRRPEEIGAIAASSKSLAKSLSESIDLSTAHSIVEYGSGTGIFTEYIMNGKPETAIFFSIELNSELAKNAQQRCPQAIIYNDSVVNVKKYMKLHDLDQCDHVISGLPWGVFGDKLQNEIIEHTVDILKPNGTLLTFTYKGSQIIPAARRFRKILNSRFSDVTTTRTVWGNLPPAYFYRCVK